MTPHEEMLAAAVEAIWQGVGQAAPKGDERRQAAQVLAGSLAAGRAVPRQADKTLSPLVGPRTDIDRAAEMPAAEAS